MTRILATILLVTLSGCAAKDPYSVSLFLSDTEKQLRAAQIVTFIADAPPYTSMNDRFKSDHVEYYKKLSERYNLIRYFVSEHQEHFYLIVRPGTSMGQKRAVGGSFRVNSTGGLDHFKELFVTTEFSEPQVEEKTSFLFDEMVKGTLADYLKMSTYVQWPNAATVYDTVSFQWRLKPLE